MQRKSCCATSVSQNFENLTENFAGATESGADSGFPLPCQDGPWANPLLGIWRRRWSGQGRVVRREKDGESFAPEGPLHQAKVDGCFAILQICEDQGEEEQLGVVLE
eukprot:s5009_g2.t1